MGGILMFKNLILRFVCAIFCLECYVYANMDLSIYGIKEPYEKDIVERYIKIFDSISKEREVVGERYLENIQNPFTTFRQGTGSGGVAGDSKSKSVGYKLYAIVDDRANINHKWYKRNSFKSGDYIRLISIKKDSVIVNIATSEGWKRREIKLNKDILDVEINSYE